MKQTGKWNPSDEHLTLKQKHKTRKQRKIQRENSAKIFAQALFGVEQERIKPNEK